MTIASRHTALLVAFASISLGACAGGGDQPTCTGGACMPPTDSGIGTDAPICTATEDADGDGIGDLAEGAGDTDGDGLPDSRDTDSDGDGLSDAEEHGIADACRVRDGDSDTTPDYKDRDRDNDGVEDGEELTRGTDPDRVDTDGDGYSDLAEVAAGSNPVDSTSRIPDRDFFVVLPYEAPSERRILNFATSIRYADVFFVIDSTGTMQPTIDAVRSQVRNIASDLIALVPDVAVGVATFEDFPVAPYGYTSDTRRTPDRPDRPFHVEQIVTSDYDEVSASLDIVAAGGGIDEQGEAGVEAIHQAVTGEGRVYPGGSVPAADCPPMSDGSRRIGAACFRPTSLPVIVYVSDEPSHNGPTLGHTYVPPRIEHAALWDDRASSETVRALNRAGVRIIGLNISNFMHQARDDMDEFAVATGALGSDGEPLVFELADPESTRTVVSRALVELVTSTPQDVETRTANLPGNPDDFDATRFMISARPVEGYRIVGGVRTAGVGYRAKDDAVFRGVVPGTEVEFEIEFVNTVRPGGSVAQVFQARIYVIGNRAAFLDERRVFIIVPSANDSVVLI